MAAPVIFTELAVAALQIAFTAMREAGLTPEEQLALYHKVDEEYVVVSAEPLPSVDG